jgi:hypothetical protein
VVEAHEPRCSALSCETVEHPDHVVRVDGPFEPRSPGTRA